ncbi:DNA-directed RNA polymerase III largest subunit RPC1 [Theileria orientalis strain Shintoku]|uniref:DNA-directed RNA polymerase subunit n=1 Tax=Theileria orientalis strain Shintoku TaxID=869250 RepID=J4C946_THEOR|nr:DNA-directed RNA polymerase III largest subunit RPC1 [Theileria orientalis strain Shintoku]BAM41903.1 DNA-directed RNA polymerase III largest subunit RPC1 [Theileria orientalis strain Shintoku]|eukprot:XP_009692204.1 DNA-directed RNA polymerase III largest subunit RPC1 [Theileria orientalis strain Shintoku]
MEGNKRQKTRKADVAPVKRESEQSSSSTSPSDQIIVQRRGELNGYSNGLKLEQEKKGLVPKSSLSFLESVPGQSQRKEYVKPTVTKYTIEGVQFDIMGSTEISRAAEIEIKNRDLYYYLTNKPYPYGVLDSRLGLKLIWNLGCNTNDMTCETCGKGLIECIGHWGYVKLELPVFHVGFFKYVIQVLYCICKKCSCLLLPEDSIRKLKEQFFKRPIEDPVVKSLIFRSVLDMCRKVKFCPRCEAPQGSIKKVVKPTTDQFMKLKHCIKQKGSSRVEVEELTPLVVKQLFENIDPIHCKVMNIENPERLIITSLAAPPNCIRPTISIQGQGTTEDDLTVDFSDIVDINNLLKNQIKNGLQTNRFIGNWQILQVQCTRFINSEYPGLNHLLTSRNITKPGRGLCERLKGKEGRFRGNLSGKRVDFSARTVISPDPNVGIDEVVIPEWIARRLTFPERVSSYNIEVMKKAILNGESVWPGASYVHKLDGSKCSLRFANPKHVSENIQVGDIVERHLWNGDLVIFNRQPSLHRLSIMCHRARIMRGSTFRFNECVCTPYNADFDGDEMNIHLPQTYEAKAESLHLLSVQKNLTTPRNGEPLIAPVQDFLCSSYLLTNKDMFLTRAQFCQIISYFTDASIHVDLPPPSIVHPVTLWTGKQAFNVLIRPNRASKVMVNLRVKEREFMDPNVYYKSGGKGARGMGDNRTKRRGPEDMDLDEEEDEQNSRESWGAAVKLDECMCPHDGYVVIYKSELLSGSLGVRSLGPTKGGLFYELMLKNSAKVSSECMLRVSKLSSRWLSEYGMTIGLDDVTPSEELINKKKQLLLDGYLRVDEAISNFEFLQPYPGCTREETLELQVKSILDELRNESGKICTSLLSPDNKPLIMFNSGSKGALINIAQMVACVGQQNVSGQRIQNGFIERTLPHFPMGCKDAKSRGFVANSFFTGLEPEEFFFHTMSGREGLIDTAVKTSETGYMQRRLMKFMEDLAICYDHSVRTGDGQVVQFLYGDDGLTSALSKSSQTTLKSSFDHIKHINPILEKVVMSSVHIDPAAVNTNQKVVKRRTKSTRSGSKTSGKESEDGYRHRWILPSEKTSEIGSKIDILLQNEDFIDNLPPQLKNKVKSYKYWIQGNNPGHKEVRFDVNVKLESGEYNIRENQINKSIDESTINTVKSHLVAYHAVYVENSYTNRNVPLLPNEIKAWSKYLQPLLIELLPPTICNNSTSQCMGSVYEFGNLIERTLEEHAEKLEQTLSEDYEKEFLSSKNESEGVVRRFKRIDKVHWLSLEQVFEFIRYTWKHYQKCICEPGEAIGALGAQSIGEPATQMTLKTFHFAGVASMNVTLGVPRIKEIIGASAKIATPIIEVPLEEKTNYDFALKVKSRIEKTTLGQVCTSVKQMYTPQSSKLLLTLNQKLINQLYLPINANKVRTRVVEIISQIKKIGKIVIPKSSVYAVGEWQICMDLGPTHHQFFQQNTLVTSILQLVVAGCKEVKRAVIKRENTAAGPNYQIAVEGYGLKEVMGADGVLWSSVKSNHVFEVAEVLGIEAARSVIISEIQKCMDAYSIDIDGRYMKLLADVMTFKGQVIGINRHGIRKMRSSTLMLSSFEQTNDHLFDAAVHHRKDPIKGVSECIIMGKPISLGTGSFDIMMAA